MLDTVMSAGTTSSAAPTFSRESVGRSLADELDWAFEDVELSPIHTLERMEIPEVRQEEGIRRAEDVIPHERVHATPAKGQLNSPAITSNDPNSNHTFDGKEKQPPAAETTGDVKKSNFVEHLNSGDRSSQPMSLKDHNKLMASKHNRELIDRRADGFFNMGPIPSDTDVERRVQQAEGIAALQRTLAPPTLSDAASSSTGSSHVSSSKAGDSVKRPSTLKKITFAEPRDRRPHRAGNPPKAGPRFSLGRDLVAAGHKKRIPEPSAPARFVRLPTDPVVNFKRTFAERGLKLSIPDPEVTTREREDPRSITSVPDVISENDLGLRNDEPKLDFGVPRGFIADQCLESTCPIRWAHAKGPYHHKGHRDNNIMTGLFGHSNPPPEIWNAYRNMMHITSDGEITSPDGRARPSVDDQLVIAFAMFHYGKLNSMSGQEFHRCYAGRHMSSRVSLQPGSTTSSTGSSGSWRLSR